MPVYEYLCRNCRRRPSFFMHGFSPPAKAVCPFCGSENLLRLFSSFALQKSDKAVYEDILSDSRLVNGMLRNDPRALAEWSKKMGEATGEGVGPEYEDMLQRMEKGEPWQNIVSEMQKEQLSSSEEKTP